ncbi:MAG: mismatch repair protein MutT [Chloroflexi bacterium]|nr:mismatch repair protein MutT [Chloroflexota bacterium]
MRCRGLRVYNRIIRDAFAGFLRKETSLTDSLSSRNIKLKLKETLSKRPVAHISDSSRIPSAVLIPIYFQEEQPYILFTQRTELVRHHKGEISFPGGGYHQGDGTLLNTALRESFEEIGLDPGDVEIMGQLDDILTRGSPYIISPFVGFISPGYVFTVSNYEIAEIIQVPILALLQSGCRTESPVEVLGGRQLVPYTYTHNSKRITGATARILKQFLDIYSSIAAQA